MREGSHVTDSAHLTTALETAREALARQDQLILRADLERTVRGDLIEAAQRLESVVGDLIHDDQLWIRLGAVDELPNRLDPDQLDRFRVLLAEDLGTVLAALGYRPPPTLVRFRDEILTHIGTLLSDEPQQTGTAKVTEAKNALVFLRYRLREVLSRTDQPRLDQPPPSELRRVVATASNVVARIAPAVTRVGVTATLAAFLGDATLAKVAGEVAGETAGGLVGILVARASLPNAIRQVDELHAQDTKELPHRRDHVVAQIHTALSRAAITWNTADRIGLDDALALAEANLDAAQKHSDLLDTREEDWIIRDAADEALAELSAAMHAATQSDSTDRPAAIAAAIQLAERYLSLRENDNQQAGAPADLDWTIVDDTASEPVRQVVKQQTEHLKERHAGRDD
jgi:hypothetical protein